jgi:D-amino-acid dehydrogenase
VAALPLRLPIQGGKGYHIDVRSGDGDTRMPTYFPERRVVATPLDGRLRLSGMLQLAGTDLSIHRGRVDAISRHASELLSGIADRPVVEVWGGLRPCSPDGLPIIGRTPALENLVLATGHGMWGLQLAPVTGRLVADIVASTANDGSDPALSPERFGRPRARVRSMSA